MALLSLLLAALLALPAQPVVASEWQLFDDREVFDLHVLPGEPPSFVALDGGTVWRLPAPGAEWVQVPVPTPEVSETDGVRLVPRNARVTGLWVAERDPQVFYVSQTYEIEIRRDGELVGSNTAARTLRSRSGGAKWSVIDASGKVSRLVVAPSSPIQIYASITDVSRQPQPPELIRIELTNRYPLAVFDQPIPVPLFNTGHMAVDAERLQQVYVSDTEAVYLSQDRGDTWSSTPLPSPSTALATHPTLNDLALLGLQSGGLWRTRDGGETWATVPGPSGDAVTQIVWDPHLEERFYAVADGRVYVTGNGGASWDALNDGLPGGAEVRRLRIDPSDPLRLFASVAEEGVWILDRVLSAYTCVPDTATLCLGPEGRFEARARWSTVGGLAGLGVANSLDRTDTGAFSFFREGNLELTVKVLDGRAINGFHWVFYASMTDVPFTLAVTDTETGQSIGYRNPNRWLASRGDTRAFPEDGFGVTPPRGAVTTPVESQVEATPCQSGATSLCLADNRFQVEVDWRGPRGGGGAGQAVPVTGDTGYFWFFREDNLELSVKILDGKLVNGRWWVFYGSLTNVAFDLTVTDTETGRRLVYSNDAGVLASRGDVDAFRQPEE